MEILIQEIKSWWYVLVSLLFFFSAMLLGDFLVSGMNKIKRLLLGGSKDD